MYHILQTKALPQQQMHVSDRQNAIQPDPVYSIKVSVLGVRCIGLHGLVHHAITLAFLLRDHQPNASSFHALWRAQTVFHLLEQKIKIKSEGCEWVLVYPGVVNSISGYRLGIGLGIGPGECLGPGNFDNRTCAVQEHASTTFDAAGSSETFFALLCTTHAYNRTHV